MNTAPSGLDPHALQAILSRYLPIYRRKEPHYQKLMLQSLLKLWRDRHSRLLDVGGGTGVIAEAIYQLLPVDYVETVDLIDRFCPGLSVSSRSYDGKSLPFPDASFDAATLNNVLHHVRHEERTYLMREIRRVVSGPLYVKDHVSRGVIDDVLLIILDAVGNIPFRGMISAHYLSEPEWTTLAEESGWRIDEFAPIESYRTGAFAFFFPNRLEVSMRLEPM